MISSYYYSYYFRILFLRGQSGRDFSLYKYTRKSIYFDASLSLPKVVVSLNNQ